MDRWNVLVLVGVLAFVSFSVRFVPALTRRGLERNLHRFVTSAGLILTDDVAGRVRSSVRRARMMEAVGAVIGTAVAGVMALALPLGRFDSGVPFLLLLGSLVGVATGGAVAARRSMHRPAENGDRVARARAVGVGDYIGAPERVGSWVAVAGAVGTAVVAEGLRAGAALVGATVALAAVTVLALLVAEVGAERLVRRPQPLETPTALAWDDAIRARAVRQSILAVGGLALWSPFMAVPVLAHRFEQFAGPLATIVPGVVWGLAILGLLLAVVTNGSQHYLRRLWPDVESRRHQPRAVAS